MVGFTPADLLKGASILTKGLSGGPSSAAARTDSSWINMWSSPFQVGDGGNSASTTQDANPSVGSGGGVGFDMWAAVIPLVAVAGAVALGIAIIKSGRGR